MTNSSTQIGKTPGRNEPCPCGSGKKYKKCCALKESASSIGTNVTINQAAEFFQRGQPQAALVACESILSKEPANGDANHICGLVYCRHGDFKKAKPYLRKAIKELPDNPWVQANLGLCLHRLGDFLGAETCCREALRIDTQCADAHNVLANVLRESDRLDEAVMHYQKAISLDPQQALFHLNLGLALQLLSRLDEAEMTYRQAIELDGSLAEAYCNLGILYREQGQIDMAYNCLQKAVTLDPDNLITLNNRGLLLEAKGDYQQAISVFQKALDAPSAPTAIKANLENVLQQQKIIVEAIHIYHACFPDDKELSAIYAEELDTCYEGDISAVDASDLALVMEPLLLLCDWPRYERALNEWVSYLKNDLKVDSNKLYIGLMLTQYSDVISIDDRNYLHQLWGERVAQEIGKEPYTHDAVNRKKSKPRIAYLSPDFRHHSVGYFIRNIIINHNYEKYEVYCYYNYPQSDDITEEIKQHCTKFEIVYDEDDKKLAARIFRDKIDILIDLAGHTTASRLRAMAAKPAPVQMTYLGYPDFTGLTAIDYRIGDIVTDTETGVGSTTEKVLKMPECFLSFGHFLVSQECSPPPVIERGYITFGSFNNLRKLTPEVIALWARILNAVENSQLVIKTRGTGHHITRKNIINEFGVHGISADRLQLIGKMVSMEAHFKYYRNIDIALDTFPYNGTTTTCEALWMGVPVVTMTGKRHIDRVSTSILRAVQLGHNCADDIKGYMDIAVALAANTEKLANMRAMLAQQVQDSLLCDPVTFTRQLEDVIISRLQSQ